MFQEARRCGRQVQPIEARRTSPRGINIGPLAHVANYDDSGTQRCMSDAQRRSEPAPPLRADSIRSSTEPEAYAVARGRAAATPFVVLARVAGVVWLAIAILSGVILLIWWLLT
jgi:hypothetical protein